MSAFGRILRVTTFGESHSPGKSNLYCRDHLFFFFLTNILTEVGCIIEGFPAR
jgi:hypothetical protein